jgi:predicted dehydrogenase
MGIVHSKAYQQLPRVYPELGVAPRFVIAADPSEERQQYAKDVLGYESATGDYHEVINHPDVEIVSICAPNFLHAEIGRAAAAAGKTFWIEKPVGRNLADTASVQEIANAGNVLSSIGFNYRHVPAIEHAKAIIARGELGTITNFRGSFFADYSADPKGALSWRFKREFAGSGVLGDLMGHLVDLIHYTLGPIDKVSALTKTVITERPELPMGSATHFAVIENGQMLPVENEDYVGMLVQIGHNGVANSAIGTLEASRVSVGPRASYNIEIYGTNGSLKWDFERMNEIHVAIGTSGEHKGYTRVMASPGQGDFGKFQPGAGTGMGYDDLKTVEAKKLFEAFLGGAQNNSNINDATAASKVVDAAERSAESGAWAHVSATTGTTAAIK